MSYFTFMGHTLIVSTQPKAGWFSLFYHYHHHYTLGGAKSPSKCCVSRQFAHTEDSRNSQVAIDRSPELTMCIRRPLRASLI